MPHIHYSHKDEKYWVKDDDEILWFDGPLAAEDGARYVKTKQAIAAEKALIVDYFRRAGMVQIADAIARGDYKS
tara:strand:- start:1542 stop:1763 length:222 start_codon:yes stop_codon:yes gene_type:complete